MICNKCNSAMTQLFLYTSFFCAECEKEQGSTHRCLDGSGGDTITLWYKADSYYDNWGGTDEKTPDNGSGTFEFYREPTNLTNLEFVFDADDVLGSRGRFNEVKAGTKPISVKRT